MNFNAKYLLILLRPIEFSIKFETVKAGWSIVYIEGLQVIISKNYFFFLRPKKFNH